MSFLKKKPFLVKLLCDLEEGKRAEAYFSDENLYLFPSYVLDNLGSCDVFEESDLHFIILIDELAMNFIKTQLDTVLNIPNQIEDATKQLYLENYPFELTSEVKNTLKQVVLENISSDDVLDKILAMGINSVGSEEIELLKLSV